MSYTVEELKELKRKWYSHAERKGYLLTIGSVGRYLGKNLNATYGPKYEYIKDGVKVYIDDYGGYLTVHVDGKLVCSTHPCEQLFVFGQWFEELEADYPAAELEENRRTAEREQKEAEKLALELGLEIRKE